MEQNEQQHRDFFIGYLADTPLLSRKALRRILPLVGLLAIGLAFVLSSSQRGEEAAVFEFGTERSIKGILLDAPEPLLKISPERAVLLIGYGKHGAWATLEEAGVKPGQQLEIAGTLIYHDGHTLMEITRGAEAVRVVGKAETGSFETPDRSLGPVDLKGEVVDPKCFFGVMKPGDGKPHRACAIRCIEGGIPPVLMVEDKPERESYGTRAYFLVRGASGEALNDRIAPHVAVPRGLEGAVEQWVDWYLIRSEPDNWEAL